MRWEHEKGNKKSSHHQQGGDSKKDNGWDAWFTIDLEQCALLDTAWLTEKSYKTKRVHSVMCSDTKRRKQRGVWNSMENTCGKKLQRMRADGSSYSPTRQTASEISRAVNLGNALSLTMKRYHILVIWGGNLIKLGSNLLSKATARKC